MSERVRVNEWKTVLQRRVTLLDFNVFHDLEGAGQMGGLCLDHLVNETLG